MAEAFARGFTDAYEIPVFTPEHVPHSAASRCSLTVVALSGEVDDLAKIDTLFGDLFPDTDLQKWIAMARRRPLAGLPARSCWIGADEAIRLGNAINELVSRGKLAAPVAIGRSIRITSGKAGGEYPSATASSDAGTQAIANSREIQTMLRATAGAAWLGVQTTENSGAGVEQSAHAAVLADGKPETFDTMARLFAKGFATALL